MGESDIVIKRKKKLLLQNQIIKDDEVIDKEIELSPYYFDITRIFYITREFDESQLIEMLKKEGYLLRKLGKNYYLVEVLNIPSKKIVSVEEKLEGIKERFKAKQLSFYDDASKISLPKEIIHLISKFLIKNNEHREMDADKAISVLQSVLGGIYELQDGSMSFLERGEIEYLAKAAVGKILKDVEQNLDKALVTILIKIRKLILSWIYEQLDISIINLKINDEQVGLLEKGIVKINGKIYKVLRLSRKYGEAFLAISKDMEILTFNLGRKRRNLITPFIQITLMNQIQMHVRLELIEIYKNALRNIEKKILYDLQCLSADYDNYKINELEDTKGLLEESIDRLYNLTNSLLNEIISDTRRRKTGLRDYRSIISKEIYGGGIPGDIERITPLRTIEQFEEAIKILESYSLSLGKLRGEILGHFNEIIKTKKENNPSLWVKAWREFRSVLEEIISSTGAKVINPQLDKLDSVYK